MMNNDYKEDVKVVENPPKQNPTKPTHKPIKIGDTAENIKSSTKDDK